MIDILQVFSIAISTKWFTARTKNWNAGDFRNFCVVAKSHIYILPIFMLNASNCENGLIKLMTVANGMYLLNKYNIVIPLQCYVVYISL